MTDWRQLAAQAAPILGALLAGPAGGAVGGMVASALGVENTDSALAEALATPEKRAELQRWAMDHRERLERLALETLQAELADTQHAREHNRHSVMPALIAVALILITSGFGAALFVAPIPAENQSTAYMLLGQLLGWTGAAIAYWVGTTRSSAEKTRRIAGK